MAEQESKEEMLVKHRGSCHCGTVKFEAWAPKVVTVWDCNCTVCQKKQNRHFIVPNSRFKIIEGADNLECYTFNTRQAKHTFCRTCGVQSFYTPRSNPDGKGISPYSIDSKTIEEMIVRKFDGSNWEREFNARGGSSALESR